MAHRKINTLDVKADYFCWVGQFLAMTPGRKSPRQFLSIQLRYVEASEGVQGLARGLEISEEGEVRSLSMGKSLRQMMMGYLVPQDWIRVVGKTKVDKHTGDLIWKAHEVVKLSKAQIDRARQLIELETTLAASNRGADLSAVSGLTDSSQSLNNVGNDTDKEVDSKVIKRPIRVLVCQKTSCRQRGSDAVAGVIAAAARAENSDTQLSNTQLTVQFVGCLKNCKAGPNIAIHPREAAQACGLETRYERITPQQAHSLATKLTTST